MDFNAMGVGDNTVGVTGNGCTVVWCTFSKAREALAYVRRRGGMWYGATGARSVDVNIVISVSS